MPGEQIKGASEAPAVKPPETLQTLLERVIKDGKIDKQELQDILARMDLEKDAITSIAKEALLRLKTEGLKDILKNGLTLSSSDKSIMTAMTENGYTISSEVQAKLATSESFVVTLEGNQVVLESEFFSTKSNDDQARISQDVMDLANDKVQAVKDFGLKNLETMKTENDDSYSQAKITKLEVAKNAIKDST